MSTKRLIDTFSQLVSIDSPTFGERKMADEVSTRLALLGFELTEDQAGEAIGGNAGNIYGYLPGTTNLNPLLFSAHLDTVEPSHGKEAMIDDQGIISSAGNTILGADDLAGISVILEAVKRLQDNGNPHRPIEILFTVAEERYCLGSDLFDYSKLKSKEAYILDLDAQQGVAANQAPSIISFEITLHGKAAHAGFDPESGVHAILGAATAITNIQMGHVDEETTCNIGLIDGGNGKNIIPDKCVVSGEIRSYSHEKALEQLNKVEHEFKVAIETLGGTYDLQSKTYIEAYLIDSTENVIRRWKNACQRANLTATLISTFGGSDNNHFAKNGIKGIVLASAMHQCHSTSEYSSVAELEKLTALVMDLMTRD